jgi:hypothetical protein
MLHFLNYFRTRIKQWQDRRFLKRHGVETWAQYNRQYDPDINWRASRVKDFYQGYPYWHIFENRNHYCYELLYDYGPGGYRYGYFDADDWCEENCKDKFRLDCHRVIKYPSTANQWEMNDLGGGDYIFAAFKNERDFFMFTLKWS